MKKAIFLAIIFTFLAATSAMATIENSRHNLSNWGAYAYKANAGGTTEVCIFCHTPHNAVKTYPLWNRSNPATTTFNFYSSGNFNMSPGGSRSGISFTTDSISLLCMSCHDGASGLFTHISNKFGETDGGTIAVDGTLGGYAAIGGDADQLRNDHPVNFQYTGSLKDPDFRTLTDAQAQGIKFFGNNYVECASCHDPHKIETGKFLRKNNNSSNLCQSCHQK